MLKAQSRFEEGGAKIGIGTEPEVLAGDFNEGSPRMWGGISGGAAMIGPGLSVCWTWNRSFPAF